MDTRPGRTTAISLGILGATAILCLLALQFAHEQLEHAYSRARGAWDLDCPVWRVTSTGDGLSRYDVAGCGRTTAYACAPMQVITPVYPLNYGISCTRPD